MLDPVQHRFFFKLCQRRQSTLVDRATFVQAPPTSQGLEVMLPPISPTSVHDRVKSRTEWPLMDPLS